MLVFVMKNRLNGLIMAVEVNKYNLGGLLVNKKPKTNILNKRGVYELSCMHCHIVYECIGQLARAIKNRIKHCKHKLK